MEKKLKHTYIISYSLIAQLVKITCNAENPSLIPGLGRSPGEGIGYPLQYSWASYGSAGKESTCNAGNLGSILGWELPLEKGKATHSSVLVWRIPWAVQSMGSQRARHD